MKSLKIIGLAALAAMALTAFVASSASAATVCSTAGKGTACKAGHGNQYTGEVHALNVGSIIFTFTSSSGAIMNVLTATSTTMLGSISDSENGLGNITALSFEGLSSSLCSVRLMASASASNPWPFAITTDGPSETTNGIMTISNMTFSYTCSLFGPVVCKYSTSNAETTIDGGDTEPKVTVKNVALEREEGPESVCGSKLDWTVTYKITTPSSLFIE
jgi:hypothetical protein